MILLASLIIWSAFGGSRRSIPNNVSRPSVVERMSDKRILFGFLNRAKSLIHRRLSISTSRWGFRPVSEICPSGFPALPNFHGIEHLRGVPVGRHPRLGEHGITLEHA